MILKGLKEQLVIEIAPSCRDFTSVRTSTTATVSVPYPERPRAAGYFVQQQNNVQRQALTGISTALSSARARPARFCFLRFQTSCQRTLNAARLLPHVARDR